MKIFKLIILTIIPFFLFVLAGLLKLEHYESWLVYLLSIGGILVLGYLFYEIRKQIKNRT